MCSDPEWGNDMASKLKVAALRIAKQIERQHQIVDKQATLATLATLDSGQQIGDNRYYIGNTRQIGNTRKICNTRQIGNKRQLGNTRWQHQIDRQHYIDRQRNKGYIINHGQGIARQKKLQTAPTAFIIINTITITITITIRIGRFKLYRFNIHCCNDTLIRNITTASDKREEQQTRLFSFKATTRSNTSFISIKDFTILITD